MVTDVERVTNLYLYGQETTPTNLTDDNLIRADVLTSNPAFHVNAQDYMNTVGRFALGAKFELVSAFFDTGNTLAARTYSKAEIATALGFSDPHDGYFMRHLDVQDGTDDYAERAYIYNSETYKISDNATFTVTSGGDRYINNFAAIPNTSVPDNFDFESESWWTVLANTFVLEPRVDPSGIGRVVDIVFDGTVSTKTYTLTDYNADLATIATWTSGDYSKLYDDIITLTNNLFSGGQTSFLDSNKPIIYGGNEADLLEASDASSYILQSDYADNGVVLIGGKGNDKLIGGIHADKLLGGEGIDTISYEYITTGGVRIDLISGNLGASEAGSTDQDTFTGIEKVFGSSQVDTVKSLIEIDGKETLVTSGDDSDGQYLEIHAPSMPSAGVKAYYFEKLELGNGNNVIKLNLSENSTLQEISIDSPDSTGRNEINISGGQPDHTGLNIYLAAGDDVIRNAPAGSRIQTGYGNDIIQLMDKVLITDASTSDKLYYADTQLHGGIRAKNSDSVYARDTNGIRYGIDTDNELQVIDSFDNTLYVANYVPSMAGILLFEVQYGAYRLLTGPGDFAGTGDIAAVMGPQIKALTGKNPFTGADPIVLDLDGDGIELTARTGVSQLFDLDANQFAVTSGWVRGDDGFLARDLNSNGIIDDGSEPHASNDNHFLRNTILAA